MKKLFSALMLSSLLFVSGTCSGSGVFSPSSYNPTSVAITGGAINGVNVTGLLRDSSVGATAQSFVGSRALATTYTNNTGATIYVYVKTTTTSYPEVMLGIVGGATMARSTSTANSYANSVTFTVPNGFTYSVTGATQTINDWSEIRQ